MFRSVRPVFAFALLGAAPALSAQTAPVAPQPPATGNVTGPASAPVAPAAPAPPPSYSEAMATGRNIAHLVMEGDITALVAAVDPQAAAGATDIPARVSQGVTAVSTSLGAERRMISEQLVRVSGRLEYRRLAEYELVPVPVIFRVILGGAPGTWRSFTLSTEENAPPGDDVKP